MMARMIQVTPMTALALQQIRKKRVKPLFPPRNSAFSGHAYCQNYDLSGPIISVIVGEPDEQQVFYVHQGVICSRSVFFSRAMNEHWESGREKKVRLEGEDPLAFSLYLEILYKDQLPREHNDESSRDPGSARDLADRTYRNLASLYVLAEFLQDPATKNLLLDTILSEARIMRDYTIRGRKFHLPQLDAIQIIYDGTPESSLARRLLVDLYDACDIVGKDTWKGVPKDFSQELSQLKASRQGVRNPDSRTHDEDKYHELVSDGVL